MQVDIAVFPGFDELDALGPLRVLRGAAGRGGNIDAWLVTSAPQEEVNGAHQIRVHPDGLWRDHADALVMVGGGWVARSSEGAREEVRKKAWVPAITDAAGRGALLGGVCTGSMILASAGVIGTRRATTHHGALEELAATGATVVTERIVDDGELVTAGGVTSGIDLGLWLIERFCGTSLADAVASDIEYDRFRPLP